MIYRSLMAILIVAIPAWLRAENPRPTQPLKVLFLGDQGHHQPQLRAREITPVLAIRGIDVTYTENLSDLNPVTLAKHDALLVYANIDQIDPVLGQNLVEYVDKGGAYVPLHCASFCFRNVPECVALTGAEFLRHGMGPFEVKDVKPDHPIMKGLELFRTIDETYVHSKHNTVNRVVLETRSEGAGEEPWTWTRTHGKGRVFYTAYGHDERTWGQPGFHDLIERGIRWAVNKGDVHDSHPRVAANLKPFEYETSDKIPIYVPSTKWGVQAEPARTMPKPSVPSESLKHLAVPEGIEARLFASEPEITKPITMAFDHRGRLWVAETVDYPNDKQPNGQGHDRIKICEDTNGDGQADKFTVFSDNLSIPTSLCFARGGVIVAQAPDMLFLQDTDGDDKADVRKVLFTGFATEDTHAGPSNLRYGFDNWIYGIIGYAGFTGSVGGEEHNFRQAFYRFRSDGSKLEVLRNTNNNSWGVGFSEDGLLFGSTANGCPSVYMPVANRYYEMVRGQSPKVLANMADSNRFFPITSKVRQVDFHGGFTAAAGHALYTARTYPKTYWNSTAFVSEPTGHLVATFALRRDGADVHSQNGWNLVASDDEWTSPIQAEVGPDGQVWMIDWYNFIVQHNPTPEGFQNGKGNAYKTPLRDKSHGRVYRLVAKNGAESANPKLDPQSPETLIAALGSPNMFWRIQAQRLLVERGNRDIVPALIKLIANRSLDAIGLNPAAIHALWTLEGLGQTRDAEVQKAIQTAMTHPSAAVRRAAVLCAVETLAEPAKTVDLSLLNDSDAQVRLAAFLVVAEMAPSDDAAQAVVKALAAGKVEGDRWMLDAATAAASHNDSGFFRALAAADSPHLSGKSAETLLGRVAEHTARSANSAALPGILAAMEKLDPKSANAIVDGLFRGWPTGKSVALDPASEATMKRLVAALPSQGRGQLVALADRWGNHSLDAFLSEIADAYLATVRDEKKPERERIATARQLVEFRKSDPDVVRALVELITPQTSPAFSGGMIAAASRSTASPVGAVLVEALPKFTPAIRPAAIRVLLDRNEWTEALMRGIESGQINFTDLSLDQRQYLASHPEGEIAARAQVLMAKGGGLPDADRQKVIDQLAQTVLKSGNASKGQLVFKEQCAKCHMHSGEGGKIGPDLSGMATHPKSELMIHILDPSRSVEGNFVQYSVATKDGRSLSGLMASESRTAVELLDAEGKTHTILRDEIDELARSKKSVMPEGFEKLIPPDAFADLLEFLTHRGKYLPLDLAKVATIISTRGMFFTEEDEVGRLVFADWSPKTFEGVPFMLVDPQGDRTANIIMLRSPNGVIPPRMPKSVSLPVNSPAKAIHLLSGVSGWGSTGDPSEPTVSMIVRLHYGDGTVEDHPLRDGVEFADYIRPIDVPGSKRAFMLRGQQIRYLAVRPQKHEKIESIDLVKGSDSTAPIVMAITVESPE